jgi:hypothetical protein
VVDGSLLLSNCCSFPLQEMVRPNELWYSLFNLPMCALYCNSLLGNLNSRRLAKGTNHIHDMSGSSTAGANSAVPHHKIMVTTDVERSGDGSAACIISLEL